MSLTSDVGSVSGTIPQLSSSSIANFVAFLSKVSGTLPTGLLNTSPGTLNFGSCRLSGDLSNLRLSSEAKFLHFQNNAISGTLNFTAPFVSLVSLLVFDNRISGTVSDDSFLFPKAADVCSNSSVGKCVPPSTTSPLEFLSAARNTLSGTLPKSLCSLSNLTAMDASSQRISGTLAECWGNAVSVKVFAIARNYLSASIPASFNSLTALQSLFLFSNRFECNAPTLDNAAQLGVGKFDGIAYPATLKCYFALAIETPQALSAVSYGLYTRSYESYVPDVSNSVLIFTGQFAT